MDNSQLDQSSLQNVLGNSGGSSVIPESLAMALTIGFILINIVTLVFIVIYIVVAIRNWKVQSALLRMQADVADIKAYLNEIPSSSTATPSTAGTYIAATDSQKELDT